MERKVKKQFKESIVKVFVHGTLIAASFFAVFPIFWLISTSFKPKADVFVTNPRLIPKRWTLENYIHVFTQSDIRNDKEKAQYKKILDTLEYTSNPDGSINLYITEFISPSDKPGDFINEQEPKIKSKYLTGIVQVRNLSQGESYRILYQLKKGSNPLRVAKKLYNKQPDYIFLRWAWNSFLVTIITSLIGLFLASTTAYAFSRFKFWGHKTGLMTFLVTQMFPGALLLVPLYNLLVNLKLLNTYPGLILAYSTVALPFSVWMLKSFFDTIPKDIEEAAFVEGLTPIQTYWTIILPLSIPGLAVVFFYNFITAWNEYMMAMTFMNNTSMYTLPVGLTTFTHQFATDWHYMSAAAIIISIPVMIVFFIAQRYLVSGLTAGSVKG